MPTFLQGYYTHRRPKTHFITPLPNETTRALCGPITFTHAFLGEYTTAPLTPSSSDALRPGMVVSTTTGERVLVGQLLPLQPAAGSLIIDYNTLRPPSNVADTIAFLPAAPSSFTLN